MIKNILKYPHKWSALKYLIRNPWLILSLSKLSSKYYFTHTISREIETDLFTDLQYFLPDEFSENFKKYQVGEDGVRYLLYLLVRKYKPDIVVETGVAQGASSAFILLAMKENKKGHLYSIDLPPNKAYIGLDITENSHSYVLEDGQKHWKDIDERIDEPGLLIPECLKDRWTLILGDSKVELPKLLKNQKQISIFFHDSLHTYEHMSFEYNTAWPYIQDGGLLISHDILWNDAFMDISKKYGKKPSIYNSLGIIEK
jgi:hypothetical protein